MWLSLALVGVAAGAMVYDAPEWLRAVTAVLAVCWAPGRAWAARWADPLDRWLATGWLGLLVGAAAFLFGKATGLGGAGVLAFAGIVAAAAPAARPGARVDPRVATGAVAGLVALCFWSAERHGAIGRPLDAYWWDPHAEELAEEARAPQPGGGWVMHKPGAWADHGALVLHPRTAHPTLIGPTDGPMLVLLRGPVGARMWLGDTPVEVTADVTVDAEEGPVWRYLDRGVAVARVDHALAGGETLDLLLDDPQHSTIYVVPSTDALWSLHNLGELTFTHYYQLLNLVEQLRWARERWVTDVQPPLWTPMLGAVEAVTGGDLVTANVLFLYVLALAGVAGLRFVRRWAPDAPLVAWLLPGAAAVVHGRLMLEPGSTPMPDSLYAVAIVTALGGPLELGGLGAALLRYPGTGVVAVGAVFAGEARRAGRMLALVVGVAVLFAVGGAVTGVLPQWFATVRWETGPEHWHDDYDPATLLGRVPAFWRIWLTYAGGAPLLAALRWPRGTRVALGTALVYSLLLCTIDHSPTHYFLPLVHLSVLAVACTAAACRTPVLRVGLPALVLVGLSIWELWGDVLG